MESVCWAAQKLLSGFSFDVARLKIAFKPLLVALELWRPFSVLRFEQVDGFRGASCDSLKSIP